MWRKFLSFLMYLWLIVGSIAVLSVGIALIIDGNRFGNSEGVRYGIEILVFGMASVLVSSAVLGAVLELMKNIEKIRKNLEEVNQKTQQALAAGLHQPQPQPVIHVWPKEVPAEGIPQQKSGYSAPVQETTYEETSVQNTVEATPTPSSASADSFAPRSASAESPAPTADTTKTGWTCSCGNKNAEDDLFCENCGKKREN